ncbi:hypothetical protein CRUP_004588 [Coryphaenoides rupestris]|nr:hypothetical protein CRUP_004588 [Coryphaenoides rupestris]
MQQTEAELQVEMESRIEAKLPAIMKNAVYLHKAAARRINSCRVQRRASRRHWLKHSKSFAVTHGNGGGGGGGGSGGGVEELRAAARKLTADSGFRESVYEIIARKDSATSLTTTRFNHREMKTTKF